MIKLLKLIAEIDNFHKFDPPIEEPSFYHNENEVIERYINKLQKQYPNGVKAIDVFENMEDYPVYMQLKTLIELAKRKMLNFSMMNVKMSPQDVLDMYGNPKDILKKTKFDPKDPTNLNERY